MGTFLILFLRKTDSLEAKNSSVMPWVYSEMAPNAINIVAPYRKLTTVDIRTGTANIMSDKEAFQMSKIVTVNFRKRSYCLW